jgi:hypothetical protein
MVQESQCLIKKLPFLPGKVYSHIFKGHTVLSGQEKLCPRADSLAMTLSPNYAFPAFLSLAHLADEASAAAVQAPPAIKDNYVTQIH